MLYQIIIIIFPFYNKNKKNYIKHQFYHINFLANHYLSTILPFTMNFIFSIYFLLMLVVIFFCSQHIYTHQLSEIC